MLPNRIELVEFAAALPLSRVWCRCVLHKYEKMQKTVKVVRFFGCSLQLVPLQPPQIRGEETVLGAAQASTWEARRSAPAAPGVLADRC